MGWWRRGSMIGVWLSLLVVGPPTFAQSKARAPDGNPSAWFGADAYPAAALRANEQGRVIAEVQIDDTGKIVSCKVISSSGSQSLDQTTCAIALDDRHYRPALDRKGHPIASKAMLPVRWVLPNGGFGEPIDVTASAPPVRSLAMTLAVDGGGLLEACHAELSGQPAGSKADPCASLEVGSRVAAGFRRDGKPVGARIVTHSTQEVVIDP